MHQRPLGLEDDSTKLNGQTLAGQKSARKLSINLPEAVSGEFRVCPPSMNLVCFPDHKGGDAIVRIRESTISRAFVGHSLEFPRRVADPARREPALRHPSSPPPERWLLSGPHPSGEHVLKSLLEGGFEFRDRASHLLRQRGHGAAVAWIISVPPAQVPVSKRSFGCLPLAALQAT